MKIRKGFVSNSSSSSYIVTIENISFEEFCNKLAPEYSWSSLFSLNSARNKLEELAIKPYSEEFKNEILGLLKELEEINEDDFVEIVKFMLKYGHINYRELKNGLELSSFTCMHNDFDSGMSERMKEILLFFMFDTKYTIKCERESD